MVTSEKSNFQEPYEIIKANLQIDYLIICNCEFVNHPNALQRMALGEDELVMQ
ncbi:unnamed protein product [Cunninghamella blakesleeana]